VINVEQVIKFKQRFNTADIYRFIGLVYQKLICKNLDKQEK